MKTVTREPKLFESSLVAMHCVSVLHGNIVFRDIAIDSVTKAIYSADICCSPKHHSAKEIPR